MCALALIGDAYSTSPLGDEKGGEKPDKALQHHIINGSRGTMGTRSRPWTRWKAINMGTMGSHDGRAIQHQYYEADFNTNGHPPHNRLHVGNAFLIVDAKGQVLVGQLAHTRSNASYDLCGDKVTGSWLPYSISEKQSLGLAYRIPLIHQQPKLVGSNYTTYDWFTERGRAVDVRKFDRDILQLLNTDEPEDLAAAIGPFKEPLEQHDVAKQGHWDAEEQANIDDVQRSLKALTEQLVFLFGESG
ncbi:MAG: hypothetical protein LQ350_003673, partial [Teloschistes chrysophthalmus]